MQGHPQHSAHSIIMLPTRQAPPCPLLILASPGGWQSTPVISSFLLPGVLPPEKTLVTPGRKGPCLPVTQDGG